MVSNDHVSKIKLYRIKDTWAYIILMSYTNHGGWILFTHIFVSLQSLYKLRKI